MSKDTLKWREETVAEDQLSRAVKRTAAIESKAQAAEAVALINDDEFWPAVEALLLECTAELARHKLPAGLGMVRVDEDAEGANLAANSL